jgi:hypothetical protein
MKLDCDCHLCVAWAFAVNAYGSTTSANAAAVLEEESLPHSQQPNVDRKELLQQPWGKVTLPATPGPHFREAIRCPPILADLSGRE